LGPKRSEKKGNRQIRKKEKSAGEGRDQLGKS